MSYNYSMNFIQFSYNNKMGFIKQSSNTCSKPYKYYCKMWYMFTVSNKDIRTMMRYFPSDITANFENVAQIRPVSLWPADFSASSCWYTK